LTPFELRFSHNPSVSHFRPFGCKCFVLKCDNVDKFESRSFDGILLGYTPHGRSNRVYNVETDTIVESCDVTIDETAPCPRGVFECTGVIPRSEIAEMKPPYVCPGCSIHTYSNNMINKCRVQ
jgi:hypothetical protein